MRINKKAEAEIADGFEGALEVIPALDRVPFYIKREAAVEAARIAFEYMKLAKRATMQREAA